jgi:nicotinamide-nucleotide amidase
MSMSSAPHSRRICVEILSQGDEVVTGQVADTNAAWMSTRFTELGFDVARHSSVGDRLPDLVAVFLEIAARAAHKDVPTVCICSGGLGPTDDDLTADAVAEAFGRPLALDAEALAAIEARYAAYGRPMPAVNRRQAMLPEGAERVENDHGTAPGFAFEESGCWFVCLPGVPREMKAMFAEQVEPRLLARFGASAGVLVTFRTVGTGESNLQECIGPFEEPDAVLAYRTKLPENHVKLRFGPSATPERIAALVERIAGCISRWTFTVEGLESVGISAESLRVDGGGGDLVHTVGRHLAAAGRTLATAESCTGGRIGAACTSVPGASAWFLESRVTYANASKVSLLGVPEAMIAEHGAVSEPVARQMAEGVRERSGADYGISVTGVAGPSGGTEAKPIGTVHIALAGPEGTTHRLFRLPGDRERVQTLAVGAALELLRRQLVLS